MFKIFHRLFDSWRVKDETPQIVHIGRNAIGVIEFYPSQVNPFINSVFTYGKIKQIKKFIRIVLSWEIVKVNTLFTREDIIEIMIL